MGTLYVLRSPRGVESLQEICNPLGIAREQGGSSLRRIISVLAAMAIVAAMVAASAMPAFAAVKTTETGNLFDLSCDPSVAACSSTFTSVGGSGSKGGGGGGTETLTGTVDFTDPDHPVVD